MQPQPAVLSEGCPRRVGQGEAGLLESHLSFVHREYGIHLFFIDFDLRCELLDNSELRWCRASRVSEAAVGWVEGCAFQSAKC